MHIELADGEGEVFGLHLRLGMGGGREEQGGKGGGRKEEITHHRRKMPFKVVALSLLL